MKESGSYPVIANALTNDGIVGYYASEFRIDAPAVTVTGRGEVGYAVARKCNFTPIARLLSIKTSHDVDFLANNINLKGFVVESTGVPQLTVPKLEDLLLYFPKQISEEIHIGNMFVKINDLITLHQRKLIFLKSHRFLMSVLFCYSWEQRKLGDIFEFERPDKYMIKDDHYEETGIPVLTANKAFILGYKNETGAYSKGDCIIFDDFTLDSKYVDFPYKINSSVIKILTLKDNSNLKFDYYLLNQAKILQQGHARHYISVVQPTIVNVPKKCESNKIEKLFTNLDSLITLHQRE